MNKSNLILLFFTVFLVLSETLWAQTELQSYEDEDSQRPTSRHREELSVSENPKIKPYIDLWYLNGYGAFRDSTRLDTLQDFYHIYHPVFENTLQAGYIGNYATPYIDYHFFNRTSDLDFFLLKTREAYLLTPQKIKYFNTRTPYTLLDYTQSEHRSRQNETRFNVLHSQNASPLLNFTFRFDQARSAGQYKHQETKNNFITLYSSYNDDKVSAHGGFISNAIFNNENGGLEDGANLLDEPDTDFLNVNLMSARTEFRNSFFFATGEYRFGRFIEIEIEDVHEERPFRASDLIEGEEEEDEEEEQSIPLAFKPMAGILYSFEYQNHLRKYSDEEDTSNGFFQNAFYGDDFIADSIRSHLIRNIIQVKQYENPERKTSFGKRAFIGQEYTRIVAPGPVYGYYNNYTKRYSNIYAGGGVFRQTGHFWKWNFEGRFFLLGRNRGQTELSGVISKPLSFSWDSLTTLNLRGQIANFVPHLFQEEYYSHRIRWKEDLKMEQRMTVNGSLKMPSSKLELAANYAIINNFIFNDTLGIPSQFDGQLLVLSAFADKDFILRDFHFRIRLLWQKASNEDVIHLPDFSAFVSTYYQFVISKVLFTQLGVDMRYNNRFYADAYDPSTGFFYLQNSEKIGGFPYIDAYASLKLKRTKVFFKLMNVGTEFIRREYFTVPGYPMNRMTFRLGVAWTFYD